MKAVTPETNSARFLNWKCVMPTKTLTLFLMSCSLKPEFTYKRELRVCMRVCVHACVRACVCVCVYVKATYAQCSYMARDRPHREHVKKTLNIAIAFCANCAVDDVCKVSACLSSSQIARPKLLHIYISL